MKKKDVDPIANSKPRPDLQVVADVPTRRALFAAQDGNPLSTPMPDISRYLLTQDFQSLASRREDETPSVRKPKPLDLFRILPEVGVKVFVVDRGPGGFFLVDPRLASELEGEKTASWRYLVVVRTRAGELFLWLLRIPEEDEGAAPWAESALEAARQALTHWTRIQWDKGASSYKISIATAAIPEPVWPEASIEQLVQRAFGHRIIDSVDHIVLKQLRGEV